MCTCAVVGNGAIIEAPATGVERACDRVSPHGVLDAIPGAQTGGARPRHPRATRRCRGAVRPLRGAASDEAEG